jgi:hypothetical protein
MVSKIHPGIAPGVKLAPHFRSAPAMEELDFRSILMERGVGVDPLESVSIELLSRVVQLLLSRHTTDEEAFFVPSPFSPIRQRVEPPRLEAAFKAQPMNEIPGRETPPFRTWRLNASLDPAADSATPSVYSPLEVSEPGEEFQCVCDPEASNILHQAQSAESSAVDRIIEEASQRHKVDSALIRAVMTAESGGNPNALSPAGARGMMQLMPATASELGVVHPFDPGENIMAGTRYLRQLLDRYRGNVKLALGAYNWGMGNLEKKPGAMPRETVNYIRRVENLYQTIVGSATGKENVSL